MFLENETRGEKMSEYVQYTVPNAEKLKELINKVKGERSMTMFADDIKRSSPNVKVSAPTISRACNWSGGKPVSIELLEAIALIADKDTGVTIENLADANGMRTKDEDSVLSKRDEFARRRQIAMEVDRSVIMIIQNEITCRGYSVRKLRGIYNGYMEQQDTVFIRNYNFGFSVSGMYPCSTWKFRINSVELSEDSNENEIEAHVGHYINRIASVFASDSFEGERYENEKYSFIFIDKKIYDVFLKRFSDHSIMVNGLMTAILIDMENYRVIEEMQLKRYDGAEASSFFKEPIFEDKGNMELFDTLDFEDEGDL